MTNFFRRNQNDDDNKNQDAFLDEEKMEEVKSISEEDFEDDAIDAVVYKVATEAQKRNENREPVLRPENDFREVLDNSVDIKEDDFDEVLDASVVSNISPSKPVEHITEKDEDEIPSFDDVEDVNEDDFDDDADEADEADEADDDDTDAVVDSADAEDDDDSDDDDSDDYESVCTICHRPESKTGPQIKMPNNFCICDDCMHKTMDSISTMDYANILGDPSLLDGMGGFNGIPFDGKGGKGIPNIRFVNLSDLQNEGIPKRQKLKKRKKTDEPLIDIKKIPAPHEIKAQLDDYIVGQEKAKKIISVAVYNHYKRVASDTMDEIEIEKSNMLMIGPTGCGKTYLVKTLAKLLDVPLAIADATSLTEAGYIGDDIESVLSKLLAAADNDVDRAQMGIVFIDEIDKIAKKQNTNSRDVSGESVQQGMLKLLEGADIEVPVGANSKNAMVPLTTINTRNILFICGGAFPDLEEIIKQRLSKQSAMGFDAVLKDHYDKEKNIHSQVTVEDLRKFGMIPEFLGRLPVIYTLDGLTEDMLVDILKEPKNAILKQYQKLLALDEVDLQFDESALKAIAKKAMEKDTGARALRAIIEEFMLDIMYEIPKDDNIGKVTITGDYIDGNGGPVISVRGSEE